MVCTTYLEFLYLKESSDPISDYNFHVDFHGYHHGQHDATMEMYDPMDSVLLVRVDFSIFEGIIHIEYIKTFFKGKGYGKIIMERISKDYGYHNIDWGMVTDSGGALKKSMDLKYGSRENYLDSLCDHIPIENINKVVNPIVRQFMVDVITTGYENAWKKWSDTIMYDKSIKKFDFNDISEICEWVKNSITNHHRPTDIVPGHIKEDFAELI